MEITSQAFSWISIQIENKGAISGKIYDWREEGIWNNDRKDREGVNWFRCRGGGWSLEASLKRGGLLVGYVWIGEMGIGKRNE